MDKKKGNSIRHLFIYKNLNLNFSKMKRGANANRVGAQSRKRLETTGAD